ncbi:MAG: DUF4918 family protein [Saprospiraceae bacterium]
MTFGQQVVKFTTALRPDWQLPSPVALLFPYEETATMNALSRFYLQYYNDKAPRIFIFGINPGRFGAGITGVPFTDPIRLAEVCGIPNDFQKKAELSSIFVYEYIQAYGGPAAFYQQYYITSLCPLGFTKEGKNYNYYDDKQLEKAVEPHIINNIKEQKAFGTTNRVAICMGQGANFKYFQKINQQHHFFDHILPVPHPRWVMQYRLKRMEEFVQVYLDAFAEAERLCLG